MSRWILPESMILHFVIHKQGNQTRTTDSYKTAVSEKAQNLLMLYTASMRAHGLDIDVLNTLNYYII